MTDIVERLRSLVSPTAREAADEIERLRSVLERVMLDFFLLQDELRQKERNVSNNLSNIGENPV